MFCYIVHGSLGAPFPRIVALLSLTGASVHDFQRVLIFYVISAKANTCLAADALNDEIVKFVEHEVVTFAIR